MDQPKQNTHFYVYLYKNVNTAVLDGLAAIVPYVRLGFVTIVWVPAATRLRHTQGQITYEMQQVYTNTY